MCQLFDLVDYVWFKGDYKIVVGGDSFVQSQSWRHQSAIKSSNTSSFRHTKRLKFVKKYYVHNLLSFCIVGCFFLGFLRILSVVSGSTDAAEDYASSVKSYMTEIEYLSSHSIRKKNAFFMINWKRSATLKNLAAHRIRSRHEVGHRCCLNLFWSSFNLWEVTVNEWSSINNGHIWITSDYV